MKLICHQVFVLVCLFKLWACVRSLQECLSFLLCLGHKITFMAYLLNFRAPETPTTITPYASSLAVRSLAGRSFEDLKGGFGDSACLVY